MSWQRSIQAAIRDLRKEEALLVKELELIQERISELETLTKEPAPRPRGAKRKTSMKNRLSPEGRAAISRAAKKRWAKHRAEDEKPKGK